MGLKEFWRGIGRRGGGRGVRYVKNELDDGLKSPSADQKADGYLLMPLLWTISQEPHPGCKSSLQEAVCRGLRVERVTGPVEQQAATRPSLKNS